MDKVNIRRLLQRAAKESQAILSQHVGERLSEQTLTHIQSEISKVFSQSKFATQIKCHEISSPIAYIEDNDIHSTSSYEEYCIRKDMKCKEKVSYDKYLEQQDFKPGDIKLDVKVKLPRPIQVAKMTFTIT